MTQVGFSRRHFGKTVGGGLLALPFVGCATGGAGVGTTGQAVGAVVVGQPIPDLKLAGVGGRGSTSLVALRGQVVLLDVWASWCEPCKVELPMLDDIARRLSGKNVVVAAVSIDQEVENMRLFVATRKKWALRFFHDPAGAVAERLAPPKMPTSYVIDQQGVVRMVNTGFERSDAKRIEQRLVTLAG
ncbi:MAG: TlpA disulfide reductase family protein [Deltaproteobacteria bacterium]|nr:TlpA disulfide reductase family protein [Deltaproteobacteria bacterium]